MTTWRKELDEALARNKEAWGDVDGSTLTETQLDAEFYPGYGGAEGCPFTLWTKNRVYFPAVYDGMEWVASTPRNPNGQATPHVGGK